MKIHILPWVQASDAKEDAGYTSGAPTPSGSVPAQSDSRKSPSVHARIDAVSNTADDKGMGAPANASPAVNPVGRKDGADARKPVFKAKKRQVIFYNLCS